MSMLAGSHAGSRRRTAAPWFPIASLALAMSLLTGCAASLGETYYLAAYDPDTRGTNYFRVTLSGSSSLSSTKFSVGFYDRAAVEKLFGETAIEREFRATQLSLFGADGKRLQSVADQLAAIEQRIPGLRRDDLDRINGSLAELIGRYRVRLAAGELRTKYYPLLDSTAALRLEAETLIAGNNLLVAAAKLREVQGYLEAIRISVDGRVLVRFFDGGGNEIDVASKVQVVFVASDASRFMEALRQLVESDQAQQDVLMVVMGPQIREARRLAAQAAASNQDTDALRTKLQDMLASIDAATVDDVKGIIGRAALAASDGIAEPKTGSDIRDFVRGMRSR